MKWIFLFTIGIVTFCGCSLRQREIELDNKLNDLREREQQLSLKEQSLDFREQQLNEREKILDSTSRKISNDSLYLKHPQLPGLWSVRMQCIETNCPGSAVGDTKNEQWEFEFQENGVIASALSNKQLVRVYAGEFFNNSLRLSVQQDTTNEQFAKILVRLQAVKEGEMTGEREIIQANGCHIVYSLELKKQ